MVSLGHTETQFRLCCKRYLNVFPPCWISYIKNKNSQTLRWETFSQRQRDHHGQTAKGAFPLTSLTRREQAAQKTPVASRFLGSICLTFWGEKKNKPFQKLQNAHTL